MEPFLKPQKVTREHTFCSIGGKAAAKIVQEESEGCLIFIFIVFWSHSLIFKLYNFTSEITSDDTRAYGSPLSTKRKGWGLGQNCLFCISYVLEGEKKIFKKKLWIEKWAFSWVRLLHTEVPFSTESGSGLPPLRDNIQKISPHIPLLAPPPCCFTRTSRILSPFPLTFLINAHQIYSQTGISINVSLLESRVWSIICWCFWEK